MPIYVFSNVTKWKQVDEQSYLLCKWTLDTEGKKTLSTSSICEYFSYIEYFQASLDKCQMEFSCDL